MQKNPVLAFALILSSLTALSASAQAVCPDLSGAYRFEVYGQIHDIELTQKGCDSVVRKIYHYSPSGKRSLLETGEYFADGKFWIDSLNTIFEARAFFEGEKLVIETKNPAYAEPIRAEWSLTADGSLRILNGVDRSFGQETFKAETIAVRL